MSTSSSSASPSLELPLSEKAVLAQQVVDWFRLQARNLPWRKTSDPYLIWVSEVMLQQTTVGTVIPYYQKFTARFPTMKSLAEASEQEVLKFWQGLGYYRRAKNLHRGAQMIQNELGGNFPRTREEILKVPGIGAYSAGSILSIAFRQKEAALDGNLIRVYSRLYALQDPVDDSAVLKRLWSIARSHVPSHKRQIRDFTEGMMELGALVCRPREPLCGICPVTALCDGWRKGVAAQIPVKAKVKRRLKLAEEVALIFDSQKVAVAKQGFDAKYPDFERLPFRSLSPEDDLGESVARFRYSVTHRDFDVWVTVHTKVPHWAKQIPISFHEPKQILKNSLLSAIDRRILKALPSVLQQTSNRHGANAARNRRKRAGKL
jgi:A/G-specific adenine glycosylase